MMSDIENLSNEYYQLLLANSPGETVYQLSNLRELCVDYSGLSQLFRHWWICKLLNHLEKQSFGSLVSPYNDLLRRAFKLSVFQLTTHSYSNRLLLAHKSIDKILMEEFRNCNSLEHALLLLEPTQYLREFEGIKYNYKTIAKGKINRFTFNFLAKKKSPSLTL